jgi:hypothetical protein
MVPLCDPSFFARSDGRLGALRAERGLPFALRTAVLKERS